MICPGCRMQFVPDFGDVYDGLNEFLAMAGVDKDTVGIVAGKNIQCPHCDSVLWAPIRGDPVLLSSVILSGRRDFQNLL